AILFGRDAQLSNFGAIASCFGAAGLFVLSDLLRRDHFEQVMAFRLRDEEERLVLVLVLPLFIIDLRELFSVRSRAFERYINAALFDGHASEFARAQLEPVSLRLPGRRFALNRLADLEPWRFLRFGFRVWF